MVLSLRPVPQHPMSLLPRSTTMGKSETVGRLALAKTRRQQGSSWRRGRQELPVQLPSKGAYGAGPVLTREPRGGVRAAWAHGSLGDTIHHSRVDRPQATVSASVADRHFTLVPSKTDMGGSWPPAFRAGSFAHPSSCSCAIRGPPNQFSGRQASLLHRRRGRDAKDQNITANNKPFLMKFHF